MLEDGAWDNSFGTRNFKWSYWGSRTCDGSALGCLLLDDQNSAGMEAAWRNLCLLKKSTAGGLLYGGPHYAQAGQPPAVIIRSAMPRCWREFWTERTVETRNAEAVELEEQKQELPAQQGIREYPELSTWRIVTPSVTGTVTAYDWEYMKGGHVSGGTLSMLHSKTLGTPLCAGMGEYIRKEPGNMQVLWKTEAECSGIRD